MEIKPKKLVLRNQFGYEEVCVTYHIQFNFQPMLMVIKISH